MFYGGERFVKQVGFKPGVLWFFRVADYDGFGWNCFHVASRTAWYL